MKLIKYFFLYINILVCCYGVTAQSNIINNGNAFTVTQIEALKSIKTESSYLDKLGFLWVVTGSNLYRYDGSEVEIISGKYGFNQNERILKISEDRENNKYFLFKNRDYFGFMPYGSMDVINISVVENETICDIHSEDEKVSLIVEGDILLRVFNFNSNNHKTEFKFEIPFKRHDQNSRILSLNKQYFIVNENMVSIYNETGNLLKRHIAAEQTESVFIDSNPFILKDKEENIYFTHYKSGEIFRLNKSDGYSKIDILDLSVKSNIIHGLWKDRNNQVIATWKNMDGFTSETLLIQLGSEIKYYSLPITERTIASINSHNFNEYVIICGYYGSSLLQNNVPIFTKYADKSLINNNYLEDGISIRGITEIDDNIYAVREIRNIFKINSQTKKIEEKYVIKSSGDTLFFRCVNDVINIDNKLWFSSCSENDINYLISYDHIEDQSIIFQAPGRIQSIGLEKDSSGFILALSRENVKSKIYRFDLKTNKFHLLNNLLFNSNSKFTFIKLHENIIFLGTKSGLEILESTPSNKISIQYQSLKKNLDNSHICFVEIYGESIIIGTLDKGLVIFNAKSGNIKEVNNQSGILSNAICGILKDNNDRYWVSSYNGLYVLDKDFEILQSFFEIDGINHNEFNRFSYYKSNDKLFFGGVNGILQVNTQDLDKIIRDSSQILLSKITYYDDNLKRTISMLYNGANTSFNLKPHQSNLAIKYISPSFWSKDVSFNLTNENQEWFLSDINKNVDLSALKPGTYSFRTNTNSWPGEIHAKSSFSHTIIVEEYFYKSNWFKFLIIISTLCLISYYLLNKRNERRKLDKIRERIADDLHDNIGSILTGIASRAEIGIIRYRDNNPTKDYNYFLTNSNKALELMRDTIWSINPENDNIDDLVDRMKDFAYNSLSHKDITLKYNIKINGNSKIINPLKRKEVYMLYKEAITNILKHSEASNVNIDISVKGNSFLIKIINDGVDKNNNSQGLGMGIKSMKKRADKIGGDVQFARSSDSFIISFRGNLLDR